MSPRLKRIRKVLNPPPIKGFKPYGPETGRQWPDPVYLLYEEYEALRLCDYDGYNHHQASVIMGISRPTFTRICASAREKIATAMVEGRTITIEGGKVYFDSNWYHCARCGCYFNNPERDKPIGHCPLCGSNEFAGFEPDDPEGDLLTGSIGDCCICPGCGYTTGHLPGKPCRQTVCPICGQTMRRENSLV
jgi:predicted DNA-binding protein (UPF0251 family)